MSCQKLAISNQFLVISDRELSARKRCFVHHASPAIIRLSLDNLKLLAAFDGAGKGNLVGVLQVAAHWKAPCGSSYLGNQRRD